MYTAATPFLSAFEPWRGRTRGRRARFSIRIPGACRPTPAGGASSLRPGAAIRTRRTQHCRRCASLLVSAVCIVVGVLGLGLVWTIARRARGPARRAASHMGGPSL